MPEPVWIERGAGKTEKGNAAACISQKQHSVGQLAFVPRSVCALLQHLGQTGDSRLVEKGSFWDQMLGDVEGLSGLSQHQSSRQGIAAQFEEVILDSDLFDTQDPAPDFDESTLDVGSFPSIGQCQGARWRGHAEIPKLLRERASLELSEGGSGNAFDENNPPRDFVGREAFRCKTPQVQLRGLNARAQYDCGCHVLTERPVRNRESGNLSERGMSG